MEKLVAPLVDDNLKQVAQVLVETFGTLGSMFSASDERIRCAFAPFTNVADRLIGARDLMQASLHETIVNVPVSSSDPHLQRYLIVKMKKLVSECLYAIFVDREMGFLREELIATGEHGSVRVRARTIIERAIDLRSTGIYLVHNHPSGCPEPSSDDISSTRELSVLASALELCVHDHLIVAGNRVVSMRACGHL